MKAVYEVKENSSAELKVTVDGEMWAKANKKAFNKIASQVTVPGFRKGHAPEAKVRQLVNNKEIMMDAVEAVAQEALNYGLDEFKEIKLVDRPMLDVESITEEEAVLKFMLTVYPEVKLGDYNAVKYAEKKVSVVKKDVEEYIEDLRKKHSEEVLKEEGTVNNGDIAVIDFEGFVDGVAFEGGKGTEYPLEIGSGSFIPGFEEQLVGMATGEEKDINVTFPEEYMEDLAGKAAVFKVKVDGIKEKVLPEVDDDFVAELKMGDDVKTVEDLTKHVKETLRAQKKEKAENEATNALLDGLCEKCEVELPECMVNQEIEDTYRDYENRMSQQGLNMDIYCQFMGTTKEQFKADLKEECEKKVRIRTILEAIADDMKVEVTEADLEDEYKALAENYGMEVEKVKEYLPTEYISEDLKIRKCLDTLKQNKPE